MKREKAAVQPLIARVQDEQERDVVKLAGLDALGHIGDPRALSPLIHVLYHEESAAVRAGAAQALGPFSDEQAMTSLLRALHTDRKILVQVSAIRALGHLRHERVVTALLDVLQSPPHSTRQTAAVQASRSARKPASHNAFARPAAANAQSHHAARDDQSSGTDWRSTGGATSHCGDARGRQRPVTQGHRHHGSRTDT